MLRYQERKHPSVQYEGRNSHELWRGAPLRNTRRKDIAQSASFLQAWLSNSLFPKIDAKHRAVASNDSFVGVL